MEEFPKMESIGDKKSEEKSFDAKLKEKVEELKKGGDKKSWLNKKFDEWREQK